MPRYKVGDLVYVKHRGYELPEEYHKYYKTVQEISEVNEQPDGIDWIRFSSMRPGWGTFFTVDEVSPASKIGNKIS